MTMMRVEPRDMTMETLSTSRRGIAVPLLAGAGCVGAMVVLGAIVRRGVPAVDTWTMRHMSAEPSGTLHTVATGTTEGLRIASVLALASAITVIWRRQRWPM